MIASPTYIFEKVYPLDVNTASNIANYVLIASAVLSVIGFLCLTRFFWLVPKLNDTSYQQRYAAQRVSGLLAIMFFVAGLITALVSSFIPDTNKAMEQRALEQESYYVKEIQQMAYHPSVELERRALNYISNAGLDIDKHCHEDKDTLEVSRSVLCKKGHVPLDTPVVMHYPDGRAAQVSFYFEEGVLRNNRFDFPQRFLKVRPIIVPVDSKLAVQE